MNKIGTLTFHNCDNYGAVLQAYALQQAIMDLGYDTEIINYSRSNIADVITMFWNKAISTIKGNPDRQLYTVKEFLEMVFKGDGNTSDVKESFLQFREKYLRCSRPVNRKTIHTIEPLYSKIIVGSDQVWNCGRVNIEPTYMLDFVSDRMKKYSYAASFGISEIPEKYYSIYKKNLSDFSCISVREKQGASLVKEITGKDAELVLDPTFLLSKDRWSNIAEKYTDEEYVLVYQLGKSNRLIDIARKYSQKKGLKIKFVKKPVEFSGEADYCKGLSPTEWVGLFKNASCVFTSSFHGIAFSIIFNKEFYAIKSEDRIRHAMQSRLVNILEEFGLEQRYIEDYDGLLKCSKIDYEDVNNRLDQLKESSIRYLKKVLSDNG